MGMNTRIIVITYLMLCCVCIHNGVKLKRLLSSSSLVCTILALVDWIKRLTSSITWNCVYGSAIFCKTDFPMSRFTSHLRKYSPKPLYSRTDTENSKYCQFSFHDVVLKAPCINNRIYLRIPFEENERCMRCLESEQDYFLATVFSFNETGFRIQMEAFYWFMTALH